MYVYFYDERDRYLGREIAALWLMSGMWSSALDRWGEENCALVIAFGIILTLVGVFW